MEKETCLPSLEHRVIEGLNSALDLAKLNVHRCKHFICILSEFKWCSVHSAGKLIINLTDKNAV